MEQNLTHQVSEMSPSSKREMQSKHNVSLERKSGIRHRQIKKRKQKSRIYMKSIESSSLKRVSGEISTKGSCDDSARRKQIRKTNHKTSGMKNSKKQLSSNLTESYQLNQTDARGNVEKANVEGKPIKSKKRRNRKCRKNNVELDEASRFQRRTRYLMIKMKLEQNLIDAYSGEGWKGQSREKIRPEKELQRAKKQILKCKLGIRDAIRQLELCGSEGCIENSVIAPDGSVHHEHIFCAKCKLREAFADNDIILCDGTCNSAFHQKCLDPPLATENIPPGDQGWFCKFCECKMEILEAMNAHIGTRFSIQSHWQDIFKEEATLPDGGCTSLNQEEEWPSDDSEDDDYDPSRNENSKGNTEDNNTSDHATSSGSLSWSFEDEVFLHSGGSNNIYSDDSIDPTVLSGRRRRRAVDYRKLYDEMFGKEGTANEQVSDDEDWGPAKRLRKERESDAATTLMTLYESEKINPQIATRNAESELETDAKTRRPSFRIPPDAVEKLRLAFAENELPSRAMKENLSKQLGLDSEKVSKWFKNARYIALKSRKADRAEQVHTSHPEITKESAILILQNRAEQMASKATSEILTQKKLTNVRQRRNPKSIVNPLAKKQQIQASVSLLADSSKGIEISDDMCLKKQMKLLKARNHMEKKRKRLGAAVYMEQLCQFEEKLYGLKQLLLTLKSYKNKESDQPHMKGGSVIYVPIAHLKEKA